MAQMSNDSNEKHTLPLKQVKLPKKKSENDLNSKELYHLDL